MATQSFRRAMQCFYYRMSTNCRFYGLQQRDFTHVRVVGTIYNRLDGRQVNFSTSSIKATRSGDSRIQKFRKVINSFVSGSKQLGNDVKLMFEIQKKLKNNAFNWDSLKTEEIIHLHQVMFQLFYSHRALVYDRNCFYKTILVI